MSEPLGGAGPLIDVHAHFYQEGCGRADWRHLNARRLEAGGRIGITWHVGSVLGSWGATSPTYFQSPGDTRDGNDAMLAFQAAHPERVRAYVAVNPNDGTFALGEIDRCAWPAGGGGAVGIKLAAARRCDSGLLDAVADRAAALAFPILHHAWQHRKGFRAGQDASDGVDIAVLAGRHPSCAFILAHIGGGGNYRHTFAAVRDVPNVYLDLSGSGVDRGMLDDACLAVGPRRLLWGADLTLCTGLARLFALDVLGLSEDERDAIRWGNAARIFPPATFGGLSATAGATTGSSPTASGGGR